MEKPSERLAQVFEETSGEILNTKTISAYTDSIERQNALMFVEIGKILDELEEKINPSLLTK